MSTAQYTTATTAGRPKSFAVAAASTAKNFSAALYQQCIQTHRKSRGAKVILLFLDWLLIVTFLS